MKYFNIVWASQVDGPGTRVVLFLQGCPLHCIWCHSPHSQPADPPLLFFEEYCNGCSKCKDICKNGCHAFNGGSHIVNRQRCSRCRKCVLHCSSGALCLSSYEEPAANLFHRLEPELRLLHSIGGLTVSGGEPLLQTDELETLLKACKSSGFHTAVETSGAAEISSFEKLARYVDCWLYGLKHIDTEKCRSQTGADFDVIYRNLSFIAKHTCGNVIIRMPVIKGYNHSSDNMEKTARIMQLLNLGCIELLPYNPYTPHFYTASGRIFDSGRFSAPSEKELAEIIDIFKGYGISSISSV